MTSLVPEVVDARRIGKDVEQLAIMLSQGMSPSRPLLMTVPGFQFASLLRDVVQKARRNKLLPPASRPGSPGRNGQAVPTWTPNPTVNQPPTDYTKFAFDQPTELFPSLDFSYAEQLLANGGPAPETNHQVCSGHRHR